MGFLDFVSMVINPPKLDQAVSVGQLPTSLLAGAEVSWSIAGVWSRSTFDCNNSSLPGESKIRSENSVFVLIQAFS